MPRRSSPAALRPLSTALATLVLASLFVSAPLAAEAHGTSSGIVWQTSWTKARAEAEAANKLIFVDLYAEWCGWCKKLERDVFSTPAFAALRTRFVFLRVDVDDGGEGSELQSRYRAGSLPTSLLLDPTGAQVGQIAGYAAADTFLEHVSEEVEAWDRLVAIHDRAVAAAKAGKAVDHAEQLAASFHERFDGLRAATLYRLALADRRGDGRLLYALADSERLAGDFEAALVTLTRAAAAANGDDELGERLDLLRFRIAHDRGDCPGAKAVLERFVADHPKSARVHDARRALRELTSSPTAACA